MKQSLPNCGKSLKKQSWQSRYVNERSTDNLSGLFPYQEGFLNNNYVIDFANLYEDTATMFNAPSGTFTASGSITISPEQRDQAMEFFTSQGRQLGRSGTITSLYGVDVYSTED